MLPFSVEIKKEYPLENTSTDLAIGNIKSGLEQVDARALSVTGARIHFTAGIFRLVSRRNLLIYVSSGTIAFQQRENKIQITSSLRFTQAVIYMLLAFLIFADRIWVASDFETPTKIIWIIFIWVLFVFGPGAYTVLRFQKFLDGCMKSAGQKSN